MGRGDQISLREWIDVALDAINTSNESLSAFGADPRTLALSSDDYLISALKVARSLANQICQVQEDLGGGGHESCSQSQLPAPGSSWVDNISVYLSNSATTNDQDYDPTRDENRGRGSGLLSPLPFSPDGEPSARSEELSDMLKSVIGDVSLLEKEDNDEENCKVADEEFKSHYLQVASAKLLMPLNNGNSNGSGEAKGSETHRIHSLGLVFYAIFSGGERPASEKRTDSETNSDDTQGKEPELLIEDQVPLSNHSNVEPIDIASNLKLLDGIKDDADNDNPVFGSFTGKHNSDPQDGQAPKKKATKQSEKMSLVSVEPLKSWGLPWSLCDLIANMIDCANGDLSGDEAYMRMEDVCSDLQLMLDKPHTYLDDLDLAKLSVTGLRLNKTVFGRNEEFATLQGSYRRSISGESELAIITGVSGTGKSVLAHRLGSFVTVNGGIFLSGKFDQLQQATPFSAIRAAFNQYCDMLVSEGESARAKKVAAELKRVLGREAYHLTRVIPSLSSIIGHDGSQYGMDQGCVDAQKRLLYLLCQFVEVISSSSGAPVALFLDDLQWADPSSIEVIHQLLLITGSLNKSQQFFFFGCVREEELNGNLPLFRMLPGVAQFGVKVTTINLTCMDEDMVNGLISDVLCLSPRITRTLAHIIYHKTKGNPLFFSKLMISLSRDGLLRLSLSHRRWEWDQEKIQSRKLPDDVAQFLTTTLVRLDTDVQMALSLLSCFGASITVSLVEALETQLKMSLLELLEKAFAEGLLDKLDGSYSFGHDRLQEAAYNLMRAEERCLYHFKYGVALVAYSLQSQSNDDGMLFTATNQLNRGGPAAVGDAEQSVLIANLNLTAGKKAMEMSDFSTAYSFFDHGISFLRKRHWQKHYDLSLELFENAAKCALFIGDIVSLKYLSQHILTFAKTFEDKLEVLHITVSALARCDLPAAVEKAVSVLSSLGEQFSDSYSLPDIKFLMEQTKTMLNTFSEEDLLKLQPMGDQLKIMAMKFLAKLELLMQLFRPSWQPIVTVKMVQLSISHGLSPMSPIGFTYFGMLVARLGSIREGYGYVKIGRKLLDKPGYNEMAGEVISMGTQVMCFVEPVQCAIEFFLQGHAAAMAAGDMSTAMMNLLVYGIGTFWAGANLKVVRDNFVTSRRMMEKQNNLMWLAHQTPLERSMLILIGTDGSELPGNHDLGEASPYASMLIYFNEVYLNFMFREFDQMKASAEKYFSYDVNSWSLLYIHTAQTFMGGLAAFWCFRKTNDPVWAERGSKAKLQMKKWADSCGWNFQSKLFLMEAEEAFCYKNIDSAKSLYEKAISLSKEHRFFNEEALAYELAGYFFMETNQQAIAVNHFLQAHEKYHDWGAIAKANAVYEFTMKSMGSSTSSLSTSSPEVH